jgi:hypothetical protein
LKDFSWLVQHRLQSLKRRDYDWVFVFDRDATLVVSCLWRLLEMRRVRFTSLDDGQKFGLPAPVDAAAEIGSRLVGVSVEAVELRDGVLDLEIRFNTGHILQVIPDSSGYEAWHLSDGSREFIAIGGGDLAVFGDDPTSG